MFQTASVTICLSCDPIRKGPNPDHNLEYQECIQFPPKQESVGYVGTYHITFYDYSLITF